MMMFQRLLSPSSHLLFQTSLVTSAHAVSYGTPLTLHMQLVPSSTYLDLVPVQCYFSELLTDRDPLIFVDDQ